MAVATEVSRRSNVIGNRRQVIAKLTAPANGDTFNTGLTDVDSIQITWAATPAAADAVGVSAVSVPTPAAPQAIATFAVVGTARDFWITVVGI